MYRQHLFLTLIFTGSYKHVCVYYDCGFVIHYKIVSLRLICSLGILTTHCTYVLHFVIGTGRMEGPRSELISEQASVGDTGLQGHCYYKRHVVRRGFVQFVHCCSSQYLLPLLNLRLVTADCNTQLVIA